MSSLSQSFNIEPDGLVFLREVTKDELPYIGKAITNRANGTLWALGDWVIECVRQGMTYPEMVTITRYSAVHLRGCERVSRRWEKELRKPTLWSIHREVMRLQDELQEPLLAKACYESWNFGEVQYHIDELARKDPKVLKVPPKTDLEVKPSTIKTRKQQPLTEVRCPECQHEFPVKGNKIKKRASDTPAPAAAGVPVAGGETA